MVRQATGEIFTYYSRNHEPEIRSGPLHGKGKAWVRGPYRPPDYPSPLNVRVGSAGIKVWMVIQWLRLCDWDEKELLERYGEVLTRGDVEAARWFYEDNKDVIDRRVAEDLESA
jgi:uncharacterized protein (DUF433 family)